MTQELSYMNIVSPRKSIWWFITSQEVLKTVMNLYILYAWKEAAHAIHKTSDMSVNTTAVSFNYGLGTCLIDECYIFAFIKCSYYAHFQCHEQFITTIQLHFDTDHNDDVQEHAIVMSCPLSIEMYNFIGHLQ